MFAAILSKLIRLRWLLICFVVSLIFTIFIVPNFHYFRVAARSFESSTQLVERGITLYQNGEFPEAIAVWEEALNLAENSERQVIILENIALARSAIGQDSLALNYWQKALNLRKELQNRLEVGRILTEQAQIYNRLGKYRSSLAILCGSEDYLNCQANSALKIARTEKDRLGIAAALGVLGDTYRLQGSLDSDLKAIEILQNSLNVAREIEKPVYVYSALNSLGNVYINLARDRYNRANLARSIDRGNNASKLEKEAIDRLEIALKQFNNALKIVQNLKNDPNGEIKTLLNLITVYNDLGREKLAREKLESALIVWERLPNSRQKIYAAVTLANLLETREINLEHFSRNNKCIRAEFRERAKELLKKAIEIGELLAATRAKSFAWGELGHIYECERNFELALKYTRKAIATSDTNFNARDSTYLWEWQIGRIFQKKGEKQAAREAYQRAVFILETIKKDILIASRDFQFNFQASINPIYRELIKLKLEQQSGQEQTQLSLKTETWQSVIDTSDALKLAELQNYLGEDCTVEIIEPSERKKLISKYKAAILNFIIFNDRSAVLLTLPNGKKQLYWLEIERKTLNAKVNEFRTGLERYRDLNYDPTPAIELYNLLIKPFAEQLRQTEVETLVIIPDGALRTIPIAALHDGKQFLIERYDIATTTGFKIEESRKNLNFQVLALGVTEAATIDNRTFPPLANVQIEIDRIKTLFPNTEVLLNQNFRSDRVSDKLNQKPFNILHIATHGQFSYEANNTFLVLGNERKLNLKNLYDLLSATEGRYNSIELLVLSACETAVGGEGTAFLGLGGLAVQAGIKTAVATLWFVQDASTADLVGKFYENLLDNNFTRVGALSEAQRALIRGDYGGEYTHPAYWAPFILIGNWS